jgi:hypothetical protein
VARDWTSVILGTAVDVQINHPHLDATSITTTDVIARNSLKLLMAAPTVGPET